MSEVVVVTSERQPQGCGRRSRPDALVDEMHGPRTGVVGLPLRLFWSGPAPAAARWDLGDVRERAHLYALVLREGTTENLRTWLDASHLRELWLPAVVREAWADRLPLDQEAQPAA